MKARLGDLAIGPRSPGRDGLNPNASDYTSSGIELRDFLIRNTDLHPDSKILDLGCGTGRLGHALRHYLQNGSYYGVDLKRSYIKHCHNQFRFRKNFRFHHVDSYHREWNPGGHQDYIIPYDNGSLDLIIIAGVLYYQDFPGIANIIHSAVPLLRSYGSMVMTIKLLNHHSMAHLSDKQYPYRTPDSWHYSIERPLLDVAIPEEGFRRLLIRNRLQIREPVKYGKWASAAGPLYPDLLTAVKV